MVAGRRRDSEQFCIAALTSYVTVVRGERGHRRDGTVRGLAAQRYRIAVLDVNAVQWNGALVRQGRKHGRMQAKNFSLQDVDDLRTVVGEFFVAYCIQRWSRSTVDGTEQAWRDPARRILDATRISVTLSMAMSVEDDDRIDMIGVGAATGDAILTIADHLDWSDEHTQLTVLPQKLNA